VAIRGILFDKDGTIVDYWATWLPINREVALYAAGGEEVLAGELLRLGGQDPVTGSIVPGSPLAAGSVADIAEAFAAHPRVRPPPGFLAGIDRIFRAGGSAHSKLVEGARATLSELSRRGFRLGLATNDSAGGLEASLAQHDILPLFDFTAGCDSGYGAKPDPGMAHAFCRAAGIRPREAAMVGDAVHDLAMGRAAGAGLTVGVLGGTSAREDLAGYADLVLDSVNEMLQRPEFQRA
jgi:phosphoglycolate phosphatase